MGENRVYIFIKILMCIPQCPLRSYYLNKHSIDMLVDIASNLVLLFCGTHYPLCTNYDFLQPSQSRKWCGN